MGVGPAAVNIGRGAPMRVRVREIVQGILAAIIGLAHRLILAANRLEARERIHGWYNASICSAVDSSDKAQACCRVRAPDPCQVRP